MARTYAGILGPLAMLTAIVRGLIHGGGATSIVVEAWCFLLAFAAVGCVAGWIAERAVDEAVSVRLRDDMAERTAKQDT